MKVVFAHNVFNRFMTLKDTIKIEKSYFSDSNICVAYNGDFINVFSEFDNIQFVGFNEKAHKIGCVNGCILSIQKLLNTDFDVLIFSHDDVFINKEHIDVVKKHIKSIVDGEYDIVCRQAPPHQWGGGYYMMEVFYISKNAVIKIFQNLSTLKNESEIPVLGTPSPERWLYLLLNGKELKINDILFEVRLDTYNLQLANQMGYYHKNVGQRGWRD